MLGTECRTGVIHLSLENGNRTEAFQVRNGVFSVNFSIDFCYRKWQLYRGEALELKSTEDARGELELTPQQQLAIRHHGSM